MKMLMFFLQLLRLLRGIQLNVLFIFLYSKMGLLKTAVVTMKENERHDGEATCRLSVPI